MSVARPPRASGFTLLELLVLLLIIGITLSFAVLSLGDRREELLEREARRLAALVQLAGEEAVLQSSQLGIEFWRGGYRFLGRGAEAWLPLDDEILRRREMPEGLHLRLSLERLPVALAERPADEPAPQVFVLSSGERTPFAVEVVLAADDRRRWQLEAAPLGAPVLTAPEVRWE